MILILEVYIVLQNSMMNTTSAITTTNVIIVTKHLFVEINNTL
jgi:hypothetical protein